MIDYKIFKNFPVLKTDRCKLIKPDPSQAKDLYEIYGDSFSMQFMQRPPAQDIKECIDIINGWNDDYKNRKGLRWAITLKNCPEKLIGTIALHYWSKKNRLIELGADINKIYWGQGIGTEVTKPVIDFAFARLNINRCELRCHPKNTGSVKIAEKFKMVYEGTLREYVYIDNKGFVDESVFSILRKDYSPL